MNPAFYFLSWVRGWNFTSALNGIKKIDVCVCFLAMVGLCCRVWAFCSHSAAACRCVVVAAHWAQALGVWASVVAVCGLRSCAAGLCGSLIPGLFWDQGSNWCPLHCKADSYPSQKPLNWIFNVPNHYILTMKEISFTFGVIHI